MLKKIKKKIIEISSNSIVVVSSPLNQSKNSETITQTDDISKEIWIQ